MTGIVGLISPESPDKCQRDVRVMLAAMSRGRRYVVGTHFARELGVYSGWCAHEGSFAAQQSNVRAINGVRVAFAGECFGDWAHESAGSAATVQSVVNEGILLRLYEAEGKDFLRRLNGLFSGVLIDSKLQNALVFIDRFGSERIYYWSKRGSTYFASNALAILSVVPEARALDDVGVAQYLQYGCTVHGRSLFRDVSILPGGTLWTVDSNATKREQTYFQPEEWDSQSPLEDEAFELEFVEVFKRILPRYLGLETNLGFSVTGGLDTRMILACMPTADVRPICYTFAGQTGETLDSRIGARVADLCRLEHHTLRIGMDFFSNFGTHLDRVVTATDGCAGALDTHEIYFTNLARQLSPVRLTGNFGSEVLRSMTTFKPIGLARELFEPSYLQLLDAHVDTPRELNPVLRAAFEEIPWQLFGTVAAARSELTFRTPYLDNEVVRLACRAPMSARQSARAALRLINDQNPKLGAVPTDRGLKSEPREAADWWRQLISTVTFKLDYLYMEGPPRGLTALESLLNVAASTGVLGQHKYLPYRRWFRGPLAGYVRDVTTDAQMRRHACWSRQGLDSIVADHLIGRRNCHREIGAVLTLEAVSRLIVNNGNYAALPDRAN